VHERRWRRAGQVIAGLAAIALVAAAFKVSLDVPLLLLALGAALCGWLTGRRRSVGAIEIGVDDDGAVRFREEDGRSEGNQERLLECVFAAPWLITLRHGTMLLPVWPDSLSEAVFRRLWVHLRWSRGIRADLRSAANDDAERR
jgi:hypothetical protein